MSSRAVNFLVLSSQFSVLSSLARSGHFGVKFVAVNLRVLSFQFLVLSSALAASCGGSPAAPTATPPAPVVETPAPTQTLSGAWTGTGTDSQGVAVISWSLTQAGSSITGTVMTRSTNPTDGSCNSCHRNKSGTVTGTLSGTTMTLTMAFAAGASGDPTPACSATLTGSASSATSGMITGTYSGSDTCEGEFRNGSLKMARQ